MIAIASLWLMSASAGIPTDAVTVSAQIKDASLEVGKSHDLVIRVKYAKGLMGSKAGIPAPIIQIDVPPSVTLSGKVLETKKELSQNEFLQAPFERLLKRSSSRVEFTLTKTPKEGEQFGINVLVYVSDRKGEEARFIRQRLIVPLQAKANGQMVDSSDSKWGIQDVLQIGDQAQPFDLPQANGSNVSLSKYLGGKNVIVTTYRAYW